MSEKHVIKLSVNDKEYTAVWKRVDWSDQPSYKFPTRYCPLCNRKIDYKEGTIYMVLCNHTLFPNCIVHGLCAMKTGVFEDATRELHNQFLTFKYQVNNSIKNNKEWARQLSVSRITQFKEI